MYRKLLVPLDGSPLAEQALEFAKAIAHATHAEVDLVIVHELSLFRGEQSDQGVRQAENRYLESLDTELEHDEPITATHQLLAGDPVGMICARALDIRADLIVMTSHGRTGFSRLWMGSVADGVIRRSHVPVLVLHSPERLMLRGPVQPLFHTMLVPLDGSAFANEILEPAVSLALASGARLHLLRVVPPVPMVIDNVTVPLVPADLPRDEPATRLLVAEAEEDLAGVVRTLATRGMTNLETEVMVSANTAEAILECAQMQRADVIAMSTHGRGASRLLVGSVTDKLLRGTHLPILVQRPHSVSVEHGLIDAEAIDHQLHATSSG